MKSTTIHLEWQGKADLPSPSTLRLERKLEVHPSGGPRKGRKAPANRLIWGDNLSVMDALLREQRSGFRLIYADPPFATGKGFQRRIGSGEDSRRPENWKMGSGYSDSWNTLEEYLSMLYPRLLRMHDLLAPDGMLYLHLDWRAVHLAKILLDEIFGASNFINEIIWVYHGPSPVKAYFNRKHDTILAYAKGKNPRFFPDRVRVPYHPSTLRTFASSPKAGFGKRPDLARGKIPEDWWYFPVIARLHNERTGYPTQKPEALLERIVRASSNPGDLVGDFFCGSGTTLRVAESLSRRWIGCDTLLQSISICQRRLALAKASPYAIDSLPGSSLLSSSHHRMRIGVETEGREIKLRLKGIEPCPPNGFPVSLDYWEVDFDFQGKVFQSAFQSARPWRTGTPELSVTHRYPRKGKYRLCVRAVCSDGSVVSMEKPVDLSAE
jgi:DNA modification methylase